MIEFELGRVNFRCPLGWTVKVVESNDEYVPKGYYVARVPQKMLEGKFRAGDRFHSDKYKLYNASLDSKDLTLFCNPDIMNASYKKDMPLNNLLKRVYKFFDKFKEDIEWNQDDSKFSYDFYKVIDSERLLEDGESDIATVEMNYIDFEEIIPGALTWKLEDK